MLPSSLDSSPPYYLKPEVLFKISNERIDTNVLPASLLPCIGYREEREDLLMFGNNYCGEQRYEGYNQCGQSQGSGSTFVLLVVLFILLIIVGSTFC